MTNNKLAGSGTLKGLELLPLYFRIYKERLTCTIIITSDRFERRLYIESGKFIFASSNAVDDSLGRFMVRRSIISEDIYTKASRYLKENKVRFGRALLEMKLIDYDQLWFSVKEHMKEIVFRTLQITRLDYRILYEPFNIEENIVLDSEMPEVLADSMRQVENQQEYVDQFFKTISTVFLANYSMGEKIALKDYEKHVLHLVKRGSNIKKLLEQSELLKSDSLRILYLFFSLGIVSSENSGIQDVEPVKEPETNNSPKSTTSFTSFEDALSYYNRKYEMVFKSLTKEIGPIAYSIISKALDEVSETLPGTLKKVSLCYDGRIEEEQILKSVWYHDFDKHINDFVRGLEELLYAELFAIKKHLGPEYEQQILKWISIQ